MTTAELTALSAYVCDINDCQGALTCGDTFCGHVCAEHEAERDADLRLEAELTRCNVCGGHHDGEDYQEWALERCAARVERQRLEAEDRSRARGMRTLMRAAQYGAPEAYRVR